MIPRNGFVVISVIEKSQYRVGAIIVPAGAEMFTEALVVGVPVNGTHTADLKVGQIVWCEYKRQVKGPEGVKAVLAGMPFKQGKHEYTVIEESQIVGILAQDMTEYVEQQRANNLAVTEAKLLS